MLYKLLSGENSNPTLDTILKIKNAFPGLNMNWLLSDELVPYKSNYDQLENYCKKLEDLVESKKKVIEYLKSIIK